MRSAPTTITSTSPLLMRWPAMLSVMSVQGIPSCTSSHAVRRAAAGDVDRLIGKLALVEEFQPIALPAQRLNFHQTTRSLPPSTGTCAAVVLAKSGPHISAASSATSFEPTSVLRRLFFLYCSTVRL